MMHIKDINNNVVMKLSFVIPYYNGIKYIDECISSIYNQSISRDECEVIIVNDNSPDSLSDEKVKEYQQRYTNLRVIHNSTNQRCGMCRNIGVQHAKGEYIWFVDQDDYIQPNCLEEILNRCVDNNLDILYFDYRNVSDDLSLNKKMNLVKNDSSVMTGLEYIHANCNGDFWHSEYDTNVWHAVYKREFLLSNNVFSPPVSYCEDLIVAQHAIIMAKRFQSIMKDYYCYRYNLESVFHTQVGKNGRLIFDASIYTGIELIRLSNLIGEDYLKEKNSVFEGGIYRINSFTKSILKNSFKQRDLFFEYINKNQSIIKNVRVYLNPLNRWIITHPNMCKYFPWLIYIVAKLI